MLALDFSRILGDDNLLARGVLYVLADLAALRQHGAVVEMSLRNEPLLQRCHETSWLADLYTYRARALLAQGDRQRADAALEQAGHLAGEHGFAWSRANALLGLARAQLEQHNPLFARVLLDEIGQLMEKMSGKSPVQSLRVEFDELQQWCAQAQEGGRAAEVAAPGARTNAPREAVFSSRRLQVWHALNLEKCRLS